jgi:hypothetical protein
MVKRSIMKDIGQENQNKTQIFSLAIYSGGSNHAVFSTVLELRGADLRFFSCVEKTIFERKNGDFLFFLFDGLDAFL